MPSRTVWPTKIKAAAGKLDASSSTSGRYKQRALKREREREQMKNLEQGINLLRRKHLREREKSLSGAFRGTS
jgi:hypothetical protein